MKTEKFLGLVFLTALILRFCHISGGNLLLLVSLGVLSLVYFPFSFYFFTNKEIRRQTLPYSIVTGFFIFIMPLAILFKMLDWAGNENMLLASILTGLLFLAITVVMYKKNSLVLKTYYQPCWSG